MSYISDHHQFTEPNEFHWHIEATGFSGDDHAAISLRRAMRKAPWANANVSFSVAERASGRDVRLQASRR